MRVSNRLRTVDEARRTWHARRVAIGEELRTRRRTSGARQGDVARAIGVSVAEVSRRERGHAPSLRVVSLCEHAAAVGLRVAITMYPTGGGVRDSAQLRYIARFLARVPDTFARELEDTIPLPGDLRAVDLVLRAPGAVVAVEVITRLGDVQAQIREARAKARDIGATRSILVVAGTHANRRVLEEVGGALAGAWDLDTRRTMAELRAGRQPGRDAIVLV